MAFPSLLNEFCWRCSSGRSCLLKYLWNGQLRVMFTHSLALRPWARCPMPVAESSGGRSPVYLSTGLRRFESLIRLFSESLAKLNCYFNGLLAVSVPAITVVVPVIPIQVPAIPVVVPAIPALFRLVHSCRIPRRSGSDGRFVALWSPRFPF